MNANTYTVNESLSALTAAWNSHDGEWVTWWDMQTVQQPYFLIQLFTVQSVWEGENRRLEQTKNGLKRKYTQEGLKVFTAFVPK